MGCLSTIRVTIGFNYCIELAGERYRTLYGTLWLVQEGLIYLYGTIYFALISKHWVYFVFFGYMLNWVGVIGIYYLPESPVILMKRGRITEAYESLEYIAKVNGRKLNSTAESFLKSDYAKSADINDSVTGDEVATVSEDELEDTSSTKYFLSFTYIKINLAVMIFCWLSSSFNYYLVLFLVKYLPGNIYVNGIMSGFGDLVAHCLGGVIYEKLGAKLGLFICFGMAVVGGFGIIYYEN